MNDRRPYTIRIKRSAAKEMDALPKTIFDRVSATILGLEVNPRPVGCKKLRGVDEYRLRAGDYRVLYTVADKERTVEVLAVGYRKDVYRGL